MTRRKAVAAISLTSVAAAQTSKSAIRDKFVGVWKLVSYQSTDKASGKVSYPYGARPVGRITYDAAGRMSAQLMNPERKRTGGPPTRSRAASLRDLSADDMREMLTGYNAYFGTFEVDEAARTVIHHVEGSLFPSWVGSDQRRSYEFSGSGRLTLTAAFDQSMSRLLWERDGK